MKSYTCTFCKRRGFSLMDLRAHQCPGKGNGQLTVLELAEVVRLNRIRKTGGAR
jgi:hypothetical protein